tara:strand:+ start:130 stop:468 length:339 start_codon:yes stop_codon:yes gene_type:complete
MSKRKPNVNVMAYMHLRVYAKRRDFLYLSRVLDMAGSRDKKYEDISVAVKNALGLVPGGKIDYVKSVIGNPAHYEHPSLLEKISDSIASELKGVEEKKRESGKLRLADEYVD